MGETHLQQMVSVPAMTMGCDLDGSSGFNHERNISAANGISASNDHADYRVKNRAHICHGGQYKGEHFLLNATRQHIITNAHHAWT